MAYFSSNHPIDKWAGWVAPAMEAGVAENVWCLEEVIALLDK
jgi:hypothetical protein